MSIRLRDLRPARTLRPAGVAAGLVSVWAVVVFTAGQSAQRSSQPPTFKAAVDIVLFGVTVLDRKGQFVTDLGRSDFDIYEDGVRQEIRVFSAGTAVSRIDAPLAGGSADGGADLPVPPVHLGLCLDTSGSMGEDLSFSQSAAVKFLRSLDQPEDATVVEFDTEVRVGRYGRADFPRLIERIRRSKADGYTALWDALGVYLDGASDAMGRKILVVYTDGGDNRSSISFHDLLQLVKASDVTIYSIGFLEHQSSLTKNEQRMVLQQVAEESGGQAYFPASIKDLESFYDKILEELRAQYSLGYISANTAQDGRWRKVEIRAKRPGLKLRTRKGYFAVYKPEKK